MTDAETIIAFLTDALEPAKLTFMPEAEEPDYIETRRELRPETAARIEAKYRKHRELVLQQQHKSVHDLWAPETGDTSFSIGNRNYGRIGGKWSETTRRKNPAHWDQPNYGVIYPGPDPHAFIALKAPRRITSRNFAKAAMQIFKNATGQSWNSASTGTDGADQELFDRCVQRKRPEPAYEIFLDGTWKRMTP